MRKRNQHLDEDRWRQGLDTNRVGLATVGDLMSKRIPSNRDQRETLAKDGQRAIYDIAEEIRADWSPVWYGAVPYLEAMGNLTGMDDMFLADTARSVVSYFLSNATTWRGETARRVKKELNAMLKGAI